VTQTRRGFLCLGVASLLSACAGLPFGLEAPEVMISDVRLLDVGLLEQRFGLSLRLLNPNDRDIAIEGLRFTVEINGKTFARGVSAQSVTLPRLGEAVIEVSAVSALTDVIRQWSVLSKGREVLDYRIYGSLLTGAMPGTLPFDRVGSIELPASGGSQRF